MKKRMLKTVLTIGSIMAFGFAIMTQCKAETSNLTAQVELTVNAWDLTILVDNASSGLNLGTVIISNEDQILSGQFAANTFQLRDFKWSESGYYTTLSVTDLVWETNSGHKITKDNISLKAWGLTTIEWVAASEAHVVIGDLSADYVSGSLTSTYINRSPVTSSEAWRLGKYGDALRVKVNIPAHTVADNYHGTITYTLYEWWNN